MSCVELRFAVLWVIFTVTCAVNCVLPSNGQETEKTRAEQEYELEPYETTFDDFDEIGLELTQSHAHTRGHARTHRTDTQPVSTRLRPPH